MKPEKRLTAAQFLRLLFETDPHTATYRDLAYCEQGLGLGTKPWWDPLNKVWADQENPYAEGADRRALWNDARELLDRLHAEYQREGKSTKEKP